MPDLPDSTPDNPAHAPQTAPDLLMDPELARQVLELARRDPGLVATGDPDNLRRLIHLARILRDRGDLDDAELLFRLVLETRERVLGPDDPETIRSVDNLARVLREQGDMDAAAPLYHRVLATRERVLGPEDP